MNVFITMKKGAVMAARSYRLLLAMWAVTLGVILLVALPLRSSLTNLFGKSMLTEKITAGFDAGIIADMTPGIGPVLSSAMNGSLLILVAGLVLFAFFAGGLFDAFTKGYGEYRVSSFMKAGARYFWAFLGLAIIVSLIIAACFMIVVGIPAGIIVAVTGDNAAPGGIANILLALCLAALPVWLLVADHSRRWMTATGSLKIFKALQEGFSSLRRRFFRSYLVVALIVLANAALTAATLWLAALAMPDSGGMVLLLFLLTQVLFVAQLYLRAWRYAAVTEMAAV